MATWITLHHPPYLRFMPSSPSSPDSYSLRRHHLPLFKPFRCAPLQRQEPQLEQSQGGKEEEDEAAIMCEDCNGKGWLLCDFCKGQKTNVKSENKKIYRRCPTCRAVGFVLCKRCKVFKCVTFPNPEDGDELLF
ncbi:hypothetical protein IGI04_016033 [Brassica rapa subsp. trilocularis]|uniref:Uncharacterized protein n=2 Tax=Brassica campestris TaxID=3711 RepID=M4ETG7_BRACM|nr:protein BUNDLE SHEATH DEFECTIVE 2, chloroplastic [Brassica rapa]KAG5401426.1 hypothetical protein IGI04_016033 [Brassica rapa subsp. trilocularis]